jgi:hypothetical protein
LFADALDSLREEAQADSRARLLWEAMMSPTDVHDDYGAAIRALPPSLPDIDPVAQADALSGHVPDFASCLMHSEVLAQAQLYSASDRRAGEAQSLFQRFTRGANGAICATAVLSAGLLVLPVLLPENAPGWSSVLLGCAGVLAGGVGAMLLGLVRESGLLRQWMRSRAEAEVARTDYFEALAAVALPHLAVPFLEYFCRFQLTSQIDYHQQRARVHNRSANRMLALGAGAVFMGAVANGLGGILGASDPKLTAVAAFGVIGAALGSLAAAMASLGQFQSNQARHEETWRALMRLRGKIDGLRVAVMAGDIAVLREFTKSVHEVMKLEHEKWLQNEQKINTALDQLDVALARSEDQRAKAMIRPVVVSDQDPAQKS